MLIDKFHRVHNYLRISVTDTCNLRCSYCMPAEDHDFLPSARIMQLDEVISLAKKFVTLGVDKIRLTGGEPLVRKDIAGIIQALSQLPVTLTLTTNAVRLHKFLPVIKNAGIRSLNISLDTLNKERFQIMTRRDQFDRVWSNIHATIDEGIHVKVNVVLIKGVNDGEINKFIKWTSETPVHVRFIEFMPFSGNHWNSGMVITFKEIIDVIEKEYSVIKLKDELNDTTRKFMVPGHAGTFAIISTMSNPFCSGCNRIRLTADGKIKNCLFSRQETDLLTALRAGQDVEELIRQSILAKHASHGGQFKADLGKVDFDAIQNRSMIAIGG
ncbi:MAG: GTP 3',8-cyclase MoaA [Flavisolibacter sp.]